MRLILREKEEECGGGVASHNRMQSFGAEAAAVGANAVLVNS